jgi:glycosyltransferase involved in cell wall biosynthesis
MENSKTGIILHDYFSMLGGGERLVGELSRHFGWPVVAGFKSSRYSEIIANGSIVGDMQWIQQVKSLQCYQGLLPFQILNLMRGFMDRSLLFIENFPMVLYSGTYAPLGVLRSPAPVNIYYCHSPARFVYDQRDFYLSAIPFWQRPVLHWLIRKFQPLYEKALATMDTIIANSENVKNRLRNYLGLDAVVVHPPCDTKRFSWSGQSNFYLSTARLDPLKRVDLVIEAFKRMPEKNLVVVSGGSEEQKLRKSAVGANNIHILGWVAEKKLKDLIGSCIATIYIPRDEDFGMSPVESMAAGKPVIGVQEGGLLETVGTDSSVMIVKNNCESLVIENVVETPYGLLIRKNPNVENVIQAVQRMTPRRTIEMRHSCETRAKEFDIRVFLESIGQICKQSFHKE